MNRAEKALVVVALLNMVLYLPPCLPSGVSAREWCSGFAFGDLSMALFRYGPQLCGVGRHDSRPVFAAVPDILTAELTWLLLILLTGGIGWVVYLLKHAPRPRTNPAVRDE